MTAENQVRDFHPLPIVLDPVVRLLGFLVFVQVTLCMSLVTVVLVVVPKSSLQFWSSFMTSLVPPRQKLSACCCFFLL